MMKAGDQVWDPSAQEELIVAVVDDETNELATSDAVERWIPAASCTLQVECSFQEHRGALARWARASGRRGIVARRALAALWSTGKLQKAGA